MSFFLEDMKILYTSFSRVLSKDGIQLTPISLNYYGKIRENGGKQRSVIAAIDFTIILDPK